MMNSKGLGRKRLWRVPAFACTDWAQPRTHSQDGRCPSRKKNHISTQ